MITIEQVEKLRGYANVSFEEAKRALELTDGNLLDAVILLEKEGKTEKKEGKYGTEEDQKNKGTEKRNHYEQYKDTVPFGTHVKNFLKACGNVLHKGNTNTFRVVKNREEIINIPVTIFIILLFIFPYVSVPLIIIGLFCDFHYSFQGPDLGGNTVNKVVNSVETVAGDIKNSVKDAVNEDKDRKDTDN